MSTEDQKASTVTLCKGVDTTKFMEDMAKAGYELHDENVPSLRNFDYVLSPTQINTLKSDSSIGSKSQKHQMELTRNTTYPEPAYEISRAWVCASPHEYTYV